MSDLFRSTTGIVGTHGQPAFTPPPSPPSWKESIGIVIAILGVALNSADKLAHGGPAWLPISGFGVLAVFLLYMPGIYIFHYARERRRRRVEEVARKEALERFTVFVNEALQLARTALDPGRYGNSSVADSITHLANNLQSPSAQEALFRRDKVIAYCVTISDLPDRVDPVLVPLVASLLSSTVRRIVDALPEYIECCERVARTEQGVTRPNKLHEAEVLRHRMTEFLRAYNLIAKQSEATGHRTLTAFATDRLVSRPVLGP